MSCRIFSDFEKLCKYKNYFAVSSYLKDMEPGLCAKLYPRALYTATCVGNTRVVKILLDNGYDPNTVGVLKCAARYGYKNIVKLLLERGADPNIPYVVYDAFVHKHNSTISVLLNNGFDPFSYDYGDTCNTLVRYIIKHNLASEDWIKENFYRIPQSVWDQVYK
jgi:hypothetical protein